MTSRQAAPCEAKKSRLRFSATETIPHGLLRSPALFCGRKCQPLLLRGNPGPNAMAPTLNSLLTVAENPWLCSSSPRAQSPHRPCRYSSRKYISGLKAWLRQKASPAPNGPLR